MAPGVVLLLMVLVLVTATGGALPPDLDDLPPAVWAAADVPRGALPWLLAFNATHGAAAAGANAGERCGGVLLRPGWALTAAHCLGPGAPPPRLLLSAGGDDALAAAAVHPHPGYRAKPLALAARSDRHLDYDVALLRLHGPPLALPPPPELVEPPPMEEDEVELLADLPLDCVIFGWGRWARATQDYSLVEEDSLKYLSVRALQYRGCDAGPPDERRVCVLGRAGQQEDNSTVVESPCSGDSGGPIVCRAPHRRGWRLLGLSSWNDEGLLCDADSRYLHLGAFRDWLEDTMSRYPQLPGPHRGKHLAVPEYPRRSAAAGVRASPPAALGLGAVAALKLASCLSACPPSLRI